MTYTREGRPTHYFEARTRSGWVSLSTRTPDKRLAQKIEAMWEELANEHRAWDVLEPVLLRQMKIGALYDLWQASGKKVVELRRQLNDVDLEPLIAPFLAVHAKKVKPDSLRHIEVHLRHLMPADKPFLRSLATTDYLTAALYGYPGKPGTTRKVHSDWSVFFAYCTKVKKFFDRNPMDDVDRPAAAKPLVRFYELKTVERIVGWQPTAERRALFALLYGTGIEITVALALTRADIVARRKEVRAAGTKTHTRDRAARVSDWAWPTLWEYAEPMLPAAKLFPNVPSRYTASDWHAATLKALELSERHPMYNARHHWAVRQLRAGAPIKLVQEQLGHASPNLTLSTYGNFRPSASDRDHWEQVATDYDKAKPGSDTAAHTANGVTTMLSNSRGGT